MTRAPFESRAPRTTSEHIASNWRAYFATVAGVIAGLVTFIAPVPQVAVISAVAAVLLGIDALKRGGPQHYGRTRAVVGVVLGGICLAYIALISVAYAIAN